MELLNLNMLNNTLNMEDQVMEACHIQAYKRPYNSLLLNRQHTAYLQKKFHEFTKLLIQFQAMSSNKLLFQQKANKLQISSSVLLKNHPINTNYCTIIHKAKERIRYLL